MNSSRRFCTDSCIGKTDEPKRRVRETSCCMKHQFVPMDDWVSRNPLPDLDQRRHQFAGRWSSRQCRYRGDVATS